MYKVGYNSKSKGYTTKTPCHRAWYNMLKRSYREAYHSEEPAYSKCSVCEEWLDYQNFAEWYQENIYTVKGECVCIDKDLLIKGNKIYSPTTCVFLPETLNKLLIGTSVSKGEYPVGVSYHKHNNKFVSYISTPTGRRFLGYFDTPDKAATVYKTEKESLIRSMADKYKEVLPPLVYNQLMEYKI